MKQLNVNLQTCSYPIIITNNFNDICKFTNKINKCVIVTDENLKNLHLNTLKEAIKYYYEDILFYVVEPGEQSKSLEIVKRMYSFFITHNICRKDIVISFGGGVVGDLAGFTAATYMRGIQLIHVPTSLLAQVDSSIGGKTAVNLLKAKNIIGSFYQPMLVYINYEIVKTLPIEEVNAIIKDAKLFEYIEVNLEKILNLELSIMAELIVWNCKIKKDIIELDEKDMGERKILNFGHTFGHAIESAMEYKYKHGECVALGILGACLISEMLGLCDCVVKERINCLLNRIGVLREINDCDPKRIYQFILHDKKVEEEKIYFILPVKIGEVIKYKIDDFSIIEEAFQKLLLL